MLVCRFCGSRIPEHSAFCGTCGRATLSSSLPTSGSSRVWPPPGDLPVFPQPPAPADTREASSQQEESRFLPIFPGPQLPASGHMPGVPGTPHIGNIPTVPGPLLRPPTSAPGTPAAPQSGSTQGNHVSSPASSHLPAPRASAPTGSPSLHHRIAGRSTGTIVRGTGGATAAVKVAVMLVIICGLVAGSVIAIPRFLHSGKTQIQRQPGSATQSRPFTQPMPPTETGCPAAGTARAMVTRPLVSGSQQNLVFEASGKLQRYDTGTHQSVLLAPAQPTVSGVNSYFPEGQVSRDGKWVVFTVQIGNQTAIQMVRMDGEGLQTLHCAPAGQTIFWMAWSPNQQTLVFNQGIESFYLTGNNQDVGSANTYLLQLTTGQLHLLLLQPAYAAQQKNEYGYLPVDWLNNTQLYLENYIICCVNNQNNYSGPNTLFLLDTRQGFNQHPGNLQTVLDLGNDLSQVALSPDKSSLFTISSPGLGPGRIMQQDATGKNTHVIYTDPDGNDEIVSFAILDQSNLLVVIQNTSETHRNGIWKFNLFNQQMTHLFVDTLQDVPNLMINAQVSLNSWANVSRDNNMYAVLDHGVSVSSNARLDIGSLQGEGPLQTILSVPENENPFVIGWTTL